MSQKEAKKQTEEQTPQVPQIDITPAIERKIGRLTIDLEAAYLQIEPMQKELNELREENKKLKEMINSDNQVNAKK